MKTLMLTLSSFALAAALAGCGSGSGSSASASPTVAPEDQAVKFAQCMRENGVQMDDPKPGQGATLAIKKGEQGKLDAALKACEAFRPVQQGDGKMSAEELDRMTKLAQCLRRNGIQADDPKQGEPFRIQAGKVGDQKTKKAMETCHAEAGMPAPGTAARAVPGSGS